MAEYDDEEVYYCKDCLSLRIVNDAEIDYCEECGSTSIGQCSIMEWEDLYRERYNKNYIDYGRRNEEVE